MRAGVFVGNPLRIGPRAQMLDRQPGKMEDPDRMLEAGMPRSRPDARDEPKLLNPLQPQKCLRIDQPQLGIGQGHDVVQAVAQHGRNRESGAHRAAESRFWMREQCLLRHGERIPVQTSAAACVAESIRWRTNRGARRLTNRRREPHGTSSGGSAPAQPFISFGFAALLVTCTYWAIDITSPAFPEIKDTFGLSAKGAGLIFSFVFLGRLFGNFPAARLLETRRLPAHRGDRRAADGRRRHRQCGLPHDRGALRRARPAGFRHRAAGQRRFAFDSVCQTGAWHRHDPVRHRVDDRRRARVAE